MIFERDEMKEMLKFKDFVPTVHQSVIIKVKANGFVVLVGCKEFVCDDLEVLMCELDSYFKGEFTDFSKQFKNELNLDCPDPGSPAALRPSETHEVGVDIPELG